MEVSSGQREGCGGMEGGMKRTGLGGSEVSWAASGLGGKWGLLSLRQALESGREALWGMAQGSHTLSG